MVSPNYVLEEEEGIDFRKWFFKILDHWFLFIAVTIATVAVAYFYNRFSAQEYQLSTSILIKEEKDPLDKSNLVRLSLYSNPYKLENEIGIINSSEIKKRTLKELDFFVEYFREKRFVRTEMYLYTPFYIGFDPFQRQPVDVEFEANYLSDSLIYLSIKETNVTSYNYSTWEYEGTINKLDISDTIKLGDTLTNGGYKFWIIPNPDGIFPGYREYSYTFAIRSLPYLLARYGDVKVNIPKGSSIMTISLRHSNPLKATLYLNNLADNYLLKGIERENTIAQRTIDFIDFQLTSIVDSLTISEQKLEDFRSSKKIVNIDYQTQYAYARQTDFDRQKAELIMEKRYLEYLQENLQSNSLSLEELIAPSTLGIKDPVLNNVVLELVEMYNERTELKLNTRRDNPYLNSLDQKIESQKDKLAETVENILDANSISLDEVNMQIAKVSEQLTRIPKDQQMLIRFERKFQLNDELYNYLLTRRSEMQIKKASNVPSNEVLEVADTDSAISVHPNKKLSYILALMAGIFIPMVFIYIKELLNNKIRSHDDIKLTSGIPVIGTIYQNDSKEPSVVVHSPTSIVAESFRMLRANLQFVVADDKCPVLVVTSAMKGEGKSFNAINLASVLSSNKKKVCLIDLDLRRPRLSEYLKLEKHDGMSNYLIGKVEVKDIIISVKNELFNLIPSGPIPPNPSELVASGKMEELMNELTKHYDYIILDSPPIGMVSDAMFISKLVGYLLLVVRHNVTYKQLLSDLVEEIERNQIKGVNLIYNDVPAGKKGYYRYGARYGYYYSDRKNTFWTRLLG